MKKIKVVLCVSDGEVVHVSERIFGYEIMLQFLIKWPDGKPWQLYIRSLTDKLDQDFALRAIEYWLGHHPEMYMKDGRIGCLRDWEMEIFQMDEPDHKRITAANCSEWDLEPVTIEVRP